MATATGASCFYYNVSTVFVVVELCNETFVEIGKTTNVLVMIEIGWFDVLVMFLHAMYISINMYQRSDQFVYMENRCAG